MVLVDMLVLLLNHLNGWSILQFKAKDNKNEIIAHCVRSWHLDSPKYGKDSLINCVSNVNDSALLIGQGISSVGT